MTRFRRGGVSLVGCRVSGLGYGALSERAARQASGGLGETALPEGFRFFKIEVVLP